MKKVIICAAMTAFSFSTPLIAESAPLLATVNYQTSVQGWVKTKTARVTVSVAASLKSEDVASRKQAIMKRLSSLYPKVQWNITSFNMSKDQTGLIGLRLSAQSRLAEGDTSSLQQKIAKLSRSGEQYKVASMAFIPTVAEMNAAKMQLRDQLYQQVVKEIAMLNKTYNKQYYPAQIQFMSAQPRPMPALYMKAANTASSPTQGSTPRLASRLTLTANVQLSAKVGNGSTSSGS